MYTIQFHANCLSNLLLNRGSFGVDDAKMGAFGDIVQKMGQICVGTLKIFVQNGCQASGNFKFCSNFC